MICLLTIGCIANIILMVEFMDYKNLIKEIELKRNNMYIKYKKSFLFKKIYKLYFNKYDELLIDLYTKYESIITNNK